MKSLIVEVANQKLEILDVDQIDGLQFVAPDGGVYEVVAYGSLPTEIDVQAVFDDEQHRQKQADGVEGDIKFAVPYNY